MMMDDDETDLCQKSFLEQPRFKQRVWKHFLSWECKQGYFDPLFSFLSFRCVIFA